MINRMFTLNYLVHKCRAHGMNQSSCEKPWEARLLPIIAPTNQAKNAIPIISSGGLAKNCSLAMENFVGLFWVQH